MRISYDWLQSYFKEELPPPEMLAEKLTMHAFEVEEIKRVGDDWVFDIDVLPNRAHDCLSHIGIARELATLLNIEVRLQYGGPKADKYLKTADFISLSVEDSKLVRRAMKRLVVDVKVGESPDWLKKRLKALGQRAINNIVDTTNYITLETGQPVHAFDFDKLAGTKKEIVIRRAHSGEKVTTLDGDEYTLTEEDLIIADTEKALDIAGIKGGANSGIDEKTTQVLLSACNFDPVAIRKTSRRLGLITDASKRFENEITPELAGAAMERLSGLVQELSGGRVTADSLDSYPRRPNNYKIGLSVDRVNKVLGTAFSESEVTKILDQFGFSYEKIQNPIAKILELAPMFAGVPYKYGASVLYDAPHLFDCSSFVSYLFVQAGIQIPRDSIDQFLFADRIEETDLRPGDLIFGKGSKPHIRESVPHGIEHVGIYLGDGKIVHASGDPDNKVVIEDYKTAPKFSGEMLRGFGRIPVAGERFVVIIPHGRLDLRIEEDVIEEIGRVYGYEHIQPIAPEPLGKEPEVNKIFYYTQKIRDTLAREGFSEVMTYSFQDTGEVEVANPRAEDKKFLRSSLVPGLTATVAHNGKYKDLLGVEKVKIFEIGTVFGRNAEHLSLALAGFGAADACEKLSKEFHAAMKARGEIVEVNLSELIEKLPDPVSYDFESIDARNVAFQPISPYPFALRDIALWASAEVISLEVEKLIKENAGEWLVRIDLFDEYRKDNKISYAFHLVFQSHEKTLSDDEVNMVMDKIYAAVREGGWEVR